jgi:hypothetical protein
MKVKESFPQQLQKKASVIRGGSFMKDNRLSATAQLQLQAQMQAHTLQKTAQLMKPGEEEKAVQGKFKTVQRQANNSTENNTEFPDTSTGSVRAIQRKSVSENRTGLPDNLKSGIENLSGYSMDDVTVHYNSPEPAQLQAHAYAQGADIHLAPGQEQHLPHEAWHVVQQKQGRVQPTQQLKGKVNINDDTGLEKEADVMGKKAMRLKVNNASENTENIPLGNSIQRKASSKNKSIIQRKVLIQGVSVEKILKNKGLKLPPNIPKDWLEDQYYRDYDSLGEFYAHALGLRVQVGLDKGLGIWYRLPLPGIGKVLSPQFFLMGELHNLFPVRNLVKESNQKNSRIISERGASFRNTAYKGSEKLSSKEDNSKEHLVELGLAKALFAFANRFAPEKEDRSGIRQEPNIVRHQIENPETAVEKPKQVIKKWEGGSVEEWEKGAQEHGPLYRDPDGRLYFTITDEEGIKAVLRPNISSASGYSIGNATGNFLKRKEILEALSENIASSYLEIVEGRLTKDNNENEYKIKYNEVFEALRKASAKNLQTVYPNMTPVLRKNPTKKNKSKHRTDIELAMDHRNTAMVEGLMKAFNQGGYVMASLGNQHVIDIKEYLQEKGGSPFLIITYSDFITKYSKNALFGKEKEPESIEETPINSKEKDKSSSLKESGPLPNPWTNAPAPDPLLVAFLKVSKLKSKEAQTLKWRLADKLIQKYGNNTEALQIGLEAQPTSDLIDLRDSYQTHLNLVPGYEVRVDEEIQKKVISLINEILEQRLSNKPHKMITDTYNPDVY